jgi:hypothetical protein
MAPFLFMAVVAWSAAAFLYAGSSRANAEALPHYRDVDIDLMIPGPDGQWDMVKIDFFMHDDGTGNFEADAEAARTDMLARYPGSYEVVPGVTAAYVSLGFTWASNTASWAYNGAGAPAGISGTAGGAIIAGASAWGSSGTNFHFTGGGASGNSTGACGGGGRDGFNTIGWVQQSGNILAVTCSHYTGNSAVEFDMEFSPSWGWTTSISPNVDLQSVATHEFGHALGLGHSAQSSAVMYYAYSSGSLKRSLTADDIQGETALYGATGGATPTPTSSATSTPTPTPSPTATPTHSPTATQTGSPTATQTSTVFPTASATGTSTPPPLATNPPGPTNPPSTATAAPAASPTPTRTPTATGTASPTTEPPPSLPILPGANLLSWPGGDLPPAAALGSQAAAIKIVYQWDPVTGTWQRFAPGLPSFLNNLPLLKKGQAYWFIANKSAQVPFAE